MNLDLFNNLINSTKENNVVKSFMKELGEFLDNNERNQTPLIEKMLAGKNLTSKYRDKINVEKINILRNCAEETIHKGEMYYIYSKSSDKSYNLGIYSKNKSDEKDIEIDEGKLPKEAGVNSVLRMENEKFILDENTTKDVESKMTEMINALLKEQNEMLEAQRIEGHLYEFVEEGKNKVWLIDITLDNGECIEEFDFPEEILESAKPGDVFQYVNGEYKIND